MEILLIGARVAAQTGVPFPHRAPCDQTRGPNTTTARIVTKSPSYEHELTTLATV